jgi:hypothetical protein
MGESFDHRPAGWIRQSRKCCIQLIHNHMVVNYPSLSSGDFGVPDFCFLGGWQRLYSWVAYRLGRCFMQTVGHSFPVLSYLLTAHYSLLTGFPSTRENPNPRPALKNRGRGTLRITKSPGHPSAILQCAIPFGTRAGATIDYRKRSCPQVLKGKLAGSKRGTVLIFQSERPPMQNVGDLSVGGGIL